MSLDVEWPEYKSDRQKAFERYVGLYFHPSDVEILWSLSDSGKRKLLDYIEGSTHHQKPGIWFSNAWRPE